MHETAHSFFNLESPAADATPGPGRLVARGWLVPKPGRHFVEMRARVGAREFPAVYGFPRPDLAAFFAPALPWLPAEFTVEVELAAGATEVVFEALDLAGAWTAVYTRAFALAAAPPAAPAPPGDPLTAFEFGRLARLGFLRGRPVDPPWPRVLRVGHPPFHGYLAQPQAVAGARYGRLQVLGWLFHDTRAIRRAFATTDLVSFQPLELGGKFAGVEARYPAHPRATDCLLHGIVDVSSHLPGPVSVRVLAELDDGSVHLCLLVRCQPILTEELKLPWPPFAPVAFWRHWRDARGRLAASGIPVESGAPRWHEFWQSLRTFRALASPRAVGLDAVGPALPAAPAAGRALRLLLITHNLNLEGAPLLFAEYAAHLAHHTGATVTVLTGEDGPLRDKFEHLGATVTVADPAITSATSAAALRAGVRRLAARVEWEQIDLVVANTLISYWGVLLAQAGGRPSLLYIHESTSPAAWFQRTFPGQLPAAHAALRAATAVSFNTPATQAYYAGLGSGRNFHLNPAWIDLAGIDAFRAGHPRDGLRARLGLRADEWLVANIGSVCERKGQHDFLRAIAWLDRCDPALAARCRFVMVGGRDTPYGRELAANLAALGRGNVTVVPETDRVFDWVGAADVFVCTSYEESFPRVVLEAMAFGVPVVSTNVHGIPSMLRDGEEAALVAPGDIAALAAGLRGVLADLPGAQARARRARARAAEFDAAMLLPHHARFTARVAAARA